MYPALYPVNNYELTALYINNNDNNNKIMTVNKKDKQDEKSSKTPLCIYIYIS